MEFFGNRLSFELDYYYRYTDKLLAQVTLPGDYNAYISQWQNAYAISNQGIELQIKADFVRSEKLHWDFSFNIARNWNRFEKSNNGMDFTNLASKHNLNIIGKPLNGIYVYNDQGYYNSQDEVPLYYVNGRRKYLSSLGNQIYTPGDRRIQDVDGNGQVATMVPLFKMFSKAGLLNTAVGFILPIISTPFMIMMFRQNARSFPVDIIEAARIDGLSEVRIFSRCSFLL